MSRSFGGRSLTREVEKSIQASSEAAEKVALLRASRFDFADAFAHQSLPPVPESLTRKIEAMTRAHRAESANDASPNPPASRLAVPVRSRLRVVPTWLAAACVAAAFAGGLLLRLGPLSNPGGSETGGTSLASAGGGQSWVAAATGYQKLYTRETVAYTEEAPAVSSKIIEDVRHKDQLDVRVPDMSSAGLTFKWIQRLSFNNKPLVQIVYLPQRGPPIALCVMKDVKPDQPVAAKTVDATNVVTWRQAELSYALIGKPEGVNMDALARQISNRGMSELFSDASHTMVAMAN
jgi:hypothetical protein